MTRNDRCPLCGFETDSVLQLHFNKKMRLPSDPEIRHCASDNFLFVANGAQPDYDEYYKSLANDSVHGEVSEGDPRSPISIMQAARLVPLLGDFFQQPRNVLDFGCGEACLLVELASQFPSSSFVGFDPGPAARIGSQKADALGLRNLAVAEFNSIVGGGPYDLIIVSHVLEHLIEFDLLRLFEEILTENGLLYVEVPDALQYPERHRQEFLYYFDRLHVNHFTAQSMSKLAARFGFGALSQFEYAFPYRDGGEYPALGMLFEKGKPFRDVSSPSIRSAAELYIAQEKQRARAESAKFAAYDGILVWGAGDNFYRSSVNGGPLSDVPNMIVMDRRPQEIVIGPRRFVTENPEEAIRRLPWPVVVTVSEGRKSMSEQIERIDPERKVFFV